MYRRIIYTTIGGQKTLAWPIEADVSKDQEGEDLGVLVPCGLMHVHQYV